MSKCRRNAKRLARMAWWHATGLLDVEWVQAHRETHPFCTYGTSPHFVPASLGEPGFYVCEREAAARERHPAGRGLRVVEER